MTPRRGRVPNGRGLTIVDSMSDGWGVEQRPHGKSVWFNSTCDGWPSATSTDRRVVNRVGAPFRPARPSGTPPVRAGMVP